MAYQSLYQLPNKLLVLRQRAGMSQGAFAARLAIDPSRWCAIEKGRRRITTAATMQQLVERLEVSDSERVELQAAFRHDQVVARLEEAGSSVEAAALVSGCLLAASLLTRAELRGLVLTIRSILASKQRLEELSKLAQSGKEVAMD